MEPSHPEYQGPERRQAQTPYQGKERRRLDWPFKAPRPTGKDEQPKEQDDRT
jgi:hypothetical protein